MDIKTPTRDIQSHCSLDKLYKVGTCPKVKQIKKQAITIKNDLRTALVIAEALLAPNLLKIVLPLEASKAKKANKIYSTTIRILFSIKKKNREISLG